MPCLQVHLSRTPRTLVGCLSLVSVTLLCTVATAARLHVNASASTGGDGASWATASNDLRATFQAAAAGDEVFIARGLYKPTTGIDQNLNFRVASGVMVYGGFVGTESTIDQRPADNDPDAADPAFDTILSGEIGAAGFADNTFNVLDLQNCSNTTRIDRLVLTRGIPGPSFPFNRGGGLRIASGAPILADCLIIDNSGSEGAGAYILSAAAPRFDRCTFRDNIAQSAGGILLQSSNPQFADCRFIGNQATNFSGGAISYTFTSGGAVSRCHFEGNSSGNNGGAIDCVLTSSPHISDSTFIDNLTPVAINGGGGALSFNTGAPVIERCTFRGNDGRQGGAVQDQGAAAAYTDCLFEMNLSQFGGGAYATGGSSYTRCTFTENTSQSGGGFYAQGPTTITDSQFLFNHATHPGTGGGGAYITSASTFTGCRFEGNTAQIGAGAYVAGAPRFSRCTIANNTSVASGAGIFAGFGSAPSFVNCLIAGNAGTIFGSAAFCSSSTNVSMVNCTIAGNTGTTQALFTSGALTISNCILRNPGAELQGGVTVGYSNIEGGAPGTGNIDADPLFTNPAADDYSLASGSPCIDAGSNALVPVGTLTDHANAARFADVQAFADTGVGPAPVVDMGALEAQAAPPSCEGDANDDGAVNFGDITSVLTGFGLAGPLGDANHDLTVDFADVTSILTNWGLLCS